jgi:hypothetical protein
MPIKPIDLRKLEENASNVYEAVIVAARRARQINDENRLEFNTLLSTMIPTIEDEFEDIEVVEMPLPDVFKLILDNQVIDGSLMLGVLFAQAKGLF